jgi:predicted PurR-regulated permease PerM
MRFFGNNNENQKVEIIISNRSVIRVLLMVVLLVFALGFLRQAAQAIILIFTAFFFALALNAPVHWISQHLPGKRRGSRVLGTSISYLFVVGLLAIFIALLVPPALSQISNFINNAPRIVADLQSQDSTTGKFIRENNLEGTVDALSDELSSFARNSGGSAVSAVGAIGTSIISTVAVLALTFMMLVEGPRWVRLAKRLLPKNRQEYGARLARDMYGVVKGFVNGQVALAAMAAIIILPVMLILDIPYAGALAAIVFICGLIPMIGHIIGATLVTIVALFNSPASAVLILSFYILYQQIENYVVQPRVQSNTTKISPLLVLSAVIIGANVNGIIGGIVAIPIMGCLRIIALDYLQSTGRLSGHETEAINRDRSEELPTTVATDTK